MTDLGICNAILAGDERCQGRLIVDREVEGIVEAVCDRCGDLAARPIRALAADSAPERDDDEPWWSR